MFTFVLLSGTRIESLRINSEETTHTFAFGGSDSSEHAQKMAGCKIRIGGKRHPTSPEDGCVIIDDCFREHLRGKSMRFDRYGYVRVNTGGKEYLLHRYLYEHHSGGSIPVGKVIHHKNDVKWDNRISNLEFTTYGHNNAAVDRKRPDATSRYKGVCLRRKTKKWRATIQLNRATIHLGDFDNEEAAAQAYDRAFIAVHGSISGSNGVLDEVGVQGVLSNREVFLPKPKKADRELPKYIYIDKQGKFRVQFRENDRTLYFRIFTDLQEAFEYRNVCLAEMSTKQDSEIRSTPIQRNDQGIAIIPVKVYNTQSEVYALVDDDDYYNLIKSTWCLNVPGYASSSKGTMHNMLKPNDDKTKVVDHIDGNKLNNQRSNLRVVSRSMNNRNCKRKREGSSSDYPGVSWDKDNNKWRASIRIGDIHKHLGRFDDEERAAARYREEYEKLESLELEAE